MRKLLVACMAVFALTCFSGSWVKAQDMKQEKQAIKLRHKVERRALKERQTLWKKSTKGQPLPKAERIRAKHERERERRELRERHKDELQDLKDRQRILRESRGYD